VPVFQQAVVVDAAEPADALQHLSVLVNGDAQPSRAYVLTQLLAPCEVGDVVIVNTTAVDLNLGTGGRHVVHWNLSRWPQTKRDTSAGMKARYVSEQLNVSMLEELPLDGIDSKRALGGVVVSFLHWQLAAVCAALDVLRVAETRAFVMTDTACMPIAISNLVTQLKRADLLHHTVTTGQSFGGDAECVNVASAIAELRRRNLCELAIVGPGPGVVGTNSTYGFGSLDVVDTMAWCARLEVPSTLALRGGLSDSRERHRGLSHHSRTVLASMPDETRVVVPETATEYLDDEFRQRHEIVVVPITKVAPLADATLARLDEANINLTSMGRPLSSDPLALHLTLAAVIDAADRLQLA
jgi:hypothetical protein